VLPVIRNDPHLANGDANLAKPPRDVRRVRILGAPGKDLIADDEDGGTASALDCMCH
jgi:hypothetical protein